MYIDYKNTFIEINYKKYQCSLGLNNFNGIQVEIKKTQNLFLVNIDNKINEDIAIGDIILSFEVRSEYLDRSYISSSSMIGFDGIFENNKKVESYSLLGLSNSLGNGALLLAYTNPVDANYIFIAKPTDCDWALECICKRENTLLLKNTVLNISPLKITRNESLSTLLSEYADGFKAKEHKEIMTGWCSWYHYYGLETQEDIIKNIDMLAKSSFKDNIGVIQIDGGWNMMKNCNDDVSGDWYPSDKFPNGMKYIADEIHKRGFKAGLWVGPFSVGIKSNLFKQHPNWVVSEPTTKLPVVNPGNVYALDLTNPDALNFLGKTFERFFDEWGFDYIKIDFLIHGVPEGIRYDRTKTSVEAFCMGMDVIRKVAKDRFILNCGSLIMPSVKYCDAMRIGADVGSRWYLPMNLEGWQHGNCALKPAIVNTLYRQWMHKKLWQNDPDCIVVREKGCASELARVKDKFFGSQITDADFGLSENEAMFMVKVVWFTNTMKLISEVIDELPDERLKMLEKCFGSFELETQIVDYYVNNELIILKTINENLYIGIFNISENDESVNLNSNKFNLQKWSFKEVFDNEEFFGEGEEIKFPIIQPRTAKIWKLEQ